MNGKFQGVSSNHVIHACLCLEIDDFQSIINVSNHKVIYAVSLSLGKRVFKVVLAIMAEGVEESFLLDEYGRSAIESMAAVPNVDNLTTCSCGGYCVHDKGQNFCPSKSINSFCSSVCHGEDFGLCMNKLAYEITTRSCFFF